MAIEIEKKSKVKGPLWLYTLLAVGLGLVLTMAAIYLYFTEANKAAAERIGELDSSLQKTTQERDLESNILAKRNKIEDFKDILEEHKKVINIFNFLQEKTHPEAWFSDFSFNLGEQTVEVAVSAEDFEAAGQQILILREEDFLKDVKASGIKEVGERGVGFNLFLTFKPQIFE